MMIIYSFFLVVFLYTAFFVASKNSHWDSFSKSIFECGFTSFFYTRFSFSIQYFLIALTFLFLDLELCFLMPYFNEESQNAKPSVFFIIFFVVLTVGLLWEWKSGLLDWKF